jgi:hypothetical protein
MKPTRFQKARHAILAFLAPLFAMVSPVAETGRRSLRAARNHELTRNDEGASAIQAIAVDGLLVLIALVLIFVTLPILTGAVSDFQDDPNTSATMSTLAGIVPLVYFFGIIILTVTLLVARVRSR